MPLRRRSNLSLKGRRRPSVYFTKPLSSLPERLAKRRNRPRSIRANREYDERCPISVRITRRYASICSLRDRRRAREEITPTNAATVFFGIPSKMDSTGMVAGFVSWVSRPVVSQLSHPGEKLTPGDEHRIIPPDPTHLNSLIFAPGTA